MVKAAPVELKVISRRLSSIEKKMSILEKIERTVEREEKDVLRKEEEIKVKEGKIQKELFRIGDFTFRKKHLLELIRGTSGAFLGVGLGQNLIKLGDLAQSLAWWNVIGILLFIIGISSLLIYKNERNEVEKRGKIIIVKKLVMLYLISLIVEFFALLLFGGTFTSIEVLIKMLIIGSYAAMAGAVSFSIL